MILPGNIYNTHAKSLIRKCSTESQFSGSNKIQKTDECVHIGDCVLIRTNKVYRKLVNIQFYE